MRYQTKLKEVEAWQLTQAMVDGKEELPPNVKLVIIPGMNTRFKLVDKSYVYGVGDYIIRENGEMRGCDQEPFKEKYQNKEECLFCVVRYNNPGKEAKWRCYHCKALLCDTCAEEHFKGERETELDKKLLDSYQWSKYLQDRIDKMDGMEKFGKELWQWLDHNGNDSNFVHELKVFVKERIGDNLIQYKPTCPNCKTNDHHAGEYCTNAKRKESPNEKI